ncbi:hypothetical protein OGAPHI_001045 [Ogataea philodendri]|uniref:Cytochrome b-c1 complex subunit 8 n=1 Tax=Ogataea philodendri TaxID=1378263 RepID=A0A9P8PF75_9ASCO|nr:uncharacterized protein OGAPHI_001045 [Ogataea philodendri]KAH3670530.1 hypothetical protein OGAPHI_001045 [Ogataea philodendri]
MTWADEEDSEEDRILSLLRTEQARTATPEQAEFNNLSKTRKLAKLTDLVKRSQVFSSIIADTLLESAQGTEAQERQKRRKTATGDAVDAKSQQPKLLTGCAMKEYQIAGMEWLITLYQNGLNGILADEMGLGKTLQSIALIAFLIEQGINGPFLVCCPLSTVSNWVAEFTRFAPDINVLAYVGSKTERPALRRKFSKCSVVITSYEISIRDFRYLSTRLWKFLIVDEGHRLKNSECLLIRQLKRLNTSNRLLLTGTPLQNNLNELWSLLNFILPEIFHDVDVFQQWFDFSALEEMKGEDSEFNELITAEIHKTLITNLHTILQPFLLRRLKKDVVQGLPPKREYIVYGKLTPQQELLYRATLAQNLKPTLLRESLKEYLEVNRLGRYTSDQIEQTIDAPETAPAKLAEHYEFVRKQVGTKKLMNVMMQLRLVCDSPHLFFYPWNGYADARLVEQSAKLQLLDQLLRPLHAKGHRVLVFTQFTSMLDLLEEYVANTLHYKTCRIDGATSQTDRQAEIDRFSAEEADVFLLSTRAGGLGINLTAADSVVLFDSDWNPQVDLQAMDRVHRIGQKNPVVVYRLVLANTVEEIMLAKADSKRRLEKLVIQLGHFESLLHYGSSRAKPQDVLLDNLDEFLVTKEFRKHEIADNTLAPEELHELLDRSQAAYEKSDAETTHGHVMLFETSSTPTAQESVRWSRLYGFGRRISGAAYGRDPIWVSGKRELSMDEVVESDAGERGVGVLAADDNGELRTDTDEPTDTTRGGAAETGSSRMRRERSGIRIRASVSREKKLAMPKSHRTTRPCESRQFSSLTSPWLIPRLCMYSNPEQISVSDSGSTLLMSFLRSLKDNDRKFDGSDDKITRSLSRSGERESRETGFGDTCWFLIEIGGTCECNSSKRRSSSSTASSNQLRKLNSLKSGTYSSSMPSMGCFPRTSLRPAWSKYALSVSDETLDSPPSTSHPWSRSWKSTAGISSSLSMLLSTRDSWIGSPKQKYITQYTVSPYAQSPLKGSLESAFFNVFRRTKAQILYVVVPGMIVWEIWARARDYNEYLYTKAGREELAIVNV